jgi:hypothetical protein
VLASHEGTATDSPSFSLEGNISPRTTAAALTEWLYSSGMTKIGDANAHAVPSSKYTTAVRIPTVRGARPRNQRANDAGADPRFESRAPGDSRPALNMFFNIRGCFGERADLTEFVADETNDGKARGRVRKRKDLGEPGPPALRRRPRGVAILPGTRAFDVVVQRPDVSFLTWRTPRFLVLRSLHCIA